MDILIKCNVGPKDRLFRTMGGLTAATLSAFFMREKPAVRVGLGVVGALGLATGMTRYCPFYDLMGIRHCQPYARSLRQLLRRL